MTTIAQTIPNYIQGISSQPDELKPLGTLVDAVNVIPDVTRGLIKRPGSSLVKDLGASATTNVSGTTQAGCWFSYYRDDTEQHIGRVYRDGSVRVWRCSDGDMKTIAANSYLAHTADGDLQFLTINDYTYVVNRNTTVTMTGTTDAYIDSGYYAYVELKQTANARQYALNLYDPDTTWSSASSWTTITTATRLKVDPRLSGTRVKEIDITATPGSGYSGANSPIANVTVASTVTRGAGALSATTLNQNGKLTATITGDAVSSVDRVMGPGGATNNRGWRKGDNVTIPDASNGATNADGVISWLVPAHKMNNDADDVTAGSCPDIDTGVFTSEDDAVIEIYKADHTRITDGSKKNLVWRWTINGVSGPIEGLNEIKDGDDYVCVYSYDVELLHGGEGWEEGDYIIFQMGGAGNYDPVEYIVTVAEIETAKVKANIKAVRPAATPFDTDTAISTTGVLGGITSELTGVSNLTTEIIGNGIYIKRTAEFNIETSEVDLMNIMTKEINDVAKLPNQCKHNYIVKVVNSDNNTNDDYYLKFKGDNDTDGNGSWVECAKPHTSSEPVKKDFTAATMPHQIVRQSNGTFTIEQPAWDPRTIGDENTNPTPSFVDKKINKVLFWRNRLVLLSGENAILSEPGKFTNFWAQTALAISPLDAIDVACSSTFPAELVDGIETNTGLALFSNNQQFLLTTDDAILSPETAKINSLATYNYNKKISPIHLGTTVGWLDNAGKYSRFFECADIKREGEPQIVEQSKLISRLLVKDIDLVANSRENSLIAFGKSGSKDVYCYRYFNSGTERLQSAWFKWELSDNLLYHVILDDVYYAVLDGTGNINPLVSFRLKDTDDSFSLTSDSVYYPLHLDNWITGAADLGSVTYSASTRKSTFAVPTGIDAAVDGDGNFIKDIVAYEVNPSSANFGKYEKVKPDGVNFELSGDWSARTFYLGYNFTMNVEFPKFFSTQTSGKVTRSDVHASLVLHRIKLNLGQTGVYETTLTRQGKPSYTELYESTISDDYLSNTPGLVDDYIQTLPVYDRNINLSLNLKSTHPSPATLYSLSWEGDYSPKYYKRV